MCSTLPQGWARLKILTAYLLSSSSELLSAMSRAWLYLFSICPFLIPHSSSLLLIVSVCLERLPLSTVLTGSFHGGLRLEWIDRRQYPCYGKFANCVWAQRCCSSSYSSSCQDIGKGPSQLRAPSAGPAGQMWPDALCAGLGEASCTQLLHAAFVKTFCISCTVPWRWFHTQLIRWLPLCDRGTLIKDVDNDNSIMGNVGSRSWDVISYCVMLPRWLMCL